jgi:hypothetical protein
LIPSKHGVYGFRKFSKIRFVDATSVNPEVLQVIRLGLFSTELELAIAGFTSPIAFHDIVERNLIGIRSPSM